MSKKILILFNWSFLSQMWNKRFNIVIYCLPPLYLVTKAICPLCKVTQRDEHKYYLSPQSYCWCKGSAPASCPFDPMWEPNKPRLKWVQEHCVSTRMRTARIASWLDHDHKLQKYYHSPSFANILIKASQHSIKLTVFLNSFTNGNIRKMFFCCNLVIFM